MRVITVLSNLVSKGVADTDDVLDNQQIYIMLMATMPKTNGRTRAAENGQ